MITPEQALMVIDGTRKTIENAPLIIDSIKYVAENGIRDGGIEIATNVFKDVLQSNGGVLETAKGVLTAEGGYQEGLKELGYCALDSVKTTVQPKTFVKNPTSMNINPKLTSTTKNIAPQNVKTFNSSMAQFAKSSLAKVGKAGAVGIIVGITSETIMSYKSYKNGELTKEQYLKEILKSGGEVGISSMATSGIMIPINVALGTVGLSTAPITIPISIVLGTAIDKVVAPAFGRGDYKKILNEARYYQNLMDMQNDLVSAMQRSNQQFIAFVDEYQRQLETHQILNQTNRYLQEQHSIANSRLQQQKANIDNTFQSLGDLYSKI